MGLPCGHTVQSLSRNNSQLQLYDFHQHWWIVERNVVPILQSPTMDISSTFANIQESFENAPRHSQIDMILQLQNLASGDPKSILANPYVSVTKGRPLGAKNKSTKRMPSAFEYAEGSVSIKRCGICRSSGHNTRTCQSK